MKPSLLSTLVSTVPLISLLVCKTLAFGRPSFSIRNVASSTSDGNTCQHLSRLPATSTSTEIMNPVFEGLEATLRSSSLQDSSSSEYVSLVSDYVLVIHLSDSSSCDGSNKSTLPIVEETWNLYSMTGKNENDFARKSKEALSLGGRDFSAESPVLTLQSSSSEAEATIRVVKSQVDTVSDSSIMLQVLMKLLAQRAFLRNDDVLKANLIDYDGSELELVSRGRALSTELFQDIGSKQAEIVEFCASSGKPIAVLPRDLVHRLNLLHRGIGVVVSENEHIQKGKDEAGFPRVYCHQRTATKRIFPSLYDMFVGGVSGAGEDPKLTAAREVEEELGLNKGLSGALSEALFDCAICTSYNRCIVTVFTYRCTDEDIKWQEEEVAWGGYVEYAEVKHAAELSIGRLVDQQKWSGSVDRGTVTNDSKFSKFEKWDFVPDGLLVWDSWVEWLLKN